MSYVIIFHYHIVNMTHSLLGQISRLEFLYELNV